MPRPHPGPAPSLIKRWSPVLLALAIVQVALIGCSSGDGQSSSQAGTGSAENPGELTIYSGRADSLVGSIIDRFEDLTGISVRVRFAGRAELASAILEEGDRSRADLFYSQDAGALAALSEGGALSQMPDDLVEQVPAEFVDAEGRWVATSGRARVLIVSIEHVDDPPESVFDLVEEEWRGRVG